MSTPRPSTPDTKGDARHALKAVAWAFGLRQADLMSRSRLSRVCEARFAAWRMLHLAGHPHAGIRRFFRRDWNAVNCGILRASDLVEIDHAYRESYNAAKAKFDELRAEKSAQKTGEN